MVANRNLLLLLFLLLLSIIPCPIKCQSDSTTSTDSPPISTTTSLITFPPMLFDSSSPSSSSLSPLDEQIVHLKEDEALDHKREREKTKEEELPLVYEDGDVPMTMMGEPMPTTSPMPTTTAGEEEIDDDTGTIRPRQAPDEQLPNPGQMADPSLMPVQLGRPDYRPLVVEGPPPVPPPPTEEPASETVEQMGDEGRAGEATTTTTAPAGEEEKQPEPAQTEATTTEEATRHTEEEAQAKQEEASAAQAKAEGKTEEAETAKEEAAAAQEEAEAAKKEAETKQEEAKEAQEQAKSGEVAQNAESAGTKVAEAVPEGGGGGDDQQQKAIDALTEALQNAHQLLVQNITIVMPRDSPSMQAFLGSLLANRPAMLTQNPPNSRGQNQQPSPAAVQALPMPLPVAPMAFVPVRPQQSPPSALYDPSSLSQMPIPQNYAFPPSPTASTAQQQRPPRASFLVEVEQLHSWIKSGRRLKLLDASYEPDAAIPDHIRFYADYYGKWDKLLKDKKSRQYERSHIPEAIPFNLNIATYPSWNERQALYPPERFEEYAQRMGINRGDQLVIYARGPLGGMLHAARAWFLFRIYGHENVTVLNGGLDAWRRADLPANDQPMEMGTLGNWTAKFRSDLVVTFEELTNADTDGYCILSRLYWYNFLDARPRNEFFGMAGTQLMAGAQQRSRLAGAKPFPADELVQQDGLMATPLDILPRLQQIGYSRRQTIVLGNTPDEASLVLLALAQVGDTKARLYNGGMEEIRRRAAYLLTSNRRRK